MGIASRSAELETYALSSSAAARGSIPANHQAKIKTTQLRVALIFTSGLLIDFARTYFESKTD